MSQWYYSDYDRNRHGPVAAKDLAQLHEAGQLDPDTLVWREGMAQWRPWREVMHEALAAASGNPLPAAPAVDATPLSAGVNPYAIAEPRPAMAAASVAMGGAEYSPYAPPRAAVHDSRSYVNGGDVVQAGFLKRLAASAIDGLVMGIVFFVILILFFGAGAATMFKSDGGLMPALGMGFILMAYVLPIIGQFVYFTWMHASRYQATLGKMAVGIKVVDGRGEGLTVGRSLGRFAARFFLYLFTCGLADLISAFMSGLTERKQAIHDMVADTLVVDRWAYTEFPERQNNALGTVTIVVLALIALAILGYFVMIVGLVAGAGMSSN